jgi:hypothetical protein
MLQRHHIGSHLVSIYLVASVLGMRTHRARAGAFIEAFTGHLGRECYFADAFEEGLRSLHDGSYVSFRLKKVFEEIFASYSRRMLDQKNPAKGMRNGLNLIEIMLPSPLPFVKKFLAKTYCILSIDLVGCLSWESKRRR